MSLPDWLGWPAARLGEAIEALARAADLPCPKFLPPLAAPDLSAASEQPRLLVLTRWIEAAAGQLGFEAEPVEARYADVIGMLRCAAPALLRIHGSQDRFLLLLAARARSVKLLASDHSVQTASIEAVREALCGALNAPLLPVLERTLAAVKPRRRDRMLRAMLESQLGTVVIRGFWLLRSPPSIGLRALMQQFAIVPRLAGLLAVHTIEYALWLTGFAVIGGSLLAGRPDWGWFSAFCLLLATALPFHLLSTRFGSLLAIDAATLLRQRLLAGALRLPTATLRKQGPGRLFGKVLEADAVESMALSGGAVAITAVTELIMVAIVLAFGPAPWFSLLALAASLLIGASLAIPYHRQRRRWTCARLAVTDELVENIVGNRTRVAQQARPGWHVREDALLGAYHGESVRLDRLQTALPVCVPRLWLALGIVSIAPSFIANDADPNLLAACLGALLLGSRALQSLALAVVDLAGAWAAWEQVAELQRAAADQPPTSAEALDSIAHRARPGVLLEAHRLAFSHGPAAKPVFDDCSLRVSLGDRVLVEGTSGAGKSTLVALLAGLQHPSAGTLLLNGLDFQTLGLDGWRARIASAPQFQDNHVLAAPFAFNLLMGRRWPPRDGDLEDAEAVCRELGLGPLLERMPSGMLQLVGDTGWQLSHGEKSRLYIARAILQVADLIILDESFAALDPETLECALQCVLKRAPALIVVAHP